MRLVIALLALLVCVFVLIAYLRPTDEPYIPPSHHEKVNLPEWPTTPGHDKG